MARGWRNLGGMLRRPVHDCGDCELSAGGKCVFAPKKLEADTLIVAQGNVPLEVGFVRIPLGRCVGIRTHRAEGNGCRLIRAGGVEVHLLAVALRTQQECAPPRRAHWCGTL